VNPFGGINCYAMIAHFGSQCFSARVGKEHTGILQGHVAIDAVLHDLLPQFGKFSALLGLMATQTAR